MSPLTCVYIRKEREMNAFSFRNDPEHGQYNQIISMKCIYMYFSTHIQVGATALASRSGSPFHNTYIGIFLQLRDTHICASYAGIHRIEDCQDNQFECPNPYSLCFAPIPITNAMVREHNMEFVGKTFGIILRWFCLPTGALCVFFSSPEHGRCSGLCFVTHAPPLHLFDSFRHVGHESPRFLYRSVILRSQSVRASMNPHWLPRASNAVFRRECSGKVFFNLRELPVQIICRPFKDCHSAHFVTMFHNLDSV